MSVGSTYFFKRKTDLVGGVGVIKEKLCFLWNVVAFTWSFGSLEVKLKVINKMSFDLEFPNYLITAEQVFIVTSWCYLGWQKNIESQKLYHVKLLNELDRRAHLNCKSFCISIDGTTTSNQSYKNECKEDSWLCRG